MAKFLRDCRLGKSKVLEADNDLEENIDNDDDEAPKPLTTTFELNDTEAAIEESDTVYLWLGANVMLSYTQDEAIELLSSKLSAAKQSLMNTVEDLEFLREQVTIMEVNTACCYNWDMKRRREKRDAERLPGKADDDLGSWSWAWAWLILL